jgi:hypothetical protein
MTQRADASGVRSIRVPVDRPLRAPYGSRRLTTDLRAFDVYAIAHAALWGLPGAGGELDVAGQRLVLSSGQALEIRVTPIAGGGVQFRAACPGCGRGAQVLYLDAPGLRCRWCARLVPPSSRNRTEDRAVPLALARVARARERIGADPTPGAPLPPRLPHWTRWAWELRLGRIRAAEEALQAAVDAAVARGRAKLAALSQPGEGGGSDGKVSASRSGGSRGLSADPCQAQSSSSRKKRALPR